MRREYKKPRTKMYCFETSYGVMGEGSIGNGGSTGGTGKTEAYSKPHGFSTTWESEDVETEASPKSTSIKY